MMGADQTTRTAGVYDFPLLLFFYALRFLLQVLKQNRHIPGLRSEAGQYYYSPVCWAVALEVYALSCYDGLYLLF